MSLLRLSGTRIANLAWERSSSVASKHVRTRFNGIRRCFQSPSINFVDHYSGDSLSSSSTKHVTTASLFTQYFTVLKTRRDGKSV